MTIYYSYSIIYHLEVLVHHYLVVVHILSSRYIGDILVDK